MLARSESPPGERAVRGFGDTALGTDRRDCWFSLPSLPVLLTDIARFTRRAYMVGLNERCGSASALPHCAAIS